MRVLLNFIFKESHIASKVFDNLIIQALKVSKYLIVTIYPSANLFYKELKKNNSSLMLKINRNLYYFLFNIQWKYC